MKSSILPAPPLDKRMRYPTRRHYYTGTAQCSWTGNRFLGQRLDLYDAHREPTTIRKETCLPLRIEMILFYRLVFFFSPWLLQWHVSTIPKMTASLTIAFDRD